MQGDCPGVFVTGSGTVVVQGKAVTHAVAEGEAVVPAVPTGLLQTPEYMNVAMTSPVDPVKAGVSEAVTLKLARRRGGLAGGSSVRSADLDGLRTARSLGVAGAGAAGWGDSHAVVPQLPRPGPDPAAEAG
jgi:hypothetical protein